MRKRTDSRRGRASSEAVVVLLVTLLALSPLGSAAAVPGVTRAAGASALVPVAGWPSFVPASDVGGAAGVPQPADLGPAGASADGAPAGALSPADAATRERVKAGLGKLPLYFVENRGQIDARAAYYVQGSATSVYFTKTGIVYALSSRTGEEKGPAQTQRHAIHLDFEGANPNVKVVGQERTEAVVSYFKGQPSEWKTALPTYNGVVYEELWPGIDLVYGGETGKLKYSFVVKPGADPSRIRLVYRGASAVRLTEAGRLAVETTAGGFEEDVPYAYQEEALTKTEVKAAFELERAAGNGEYRFGFRVGAYDTSKTLVLDPVVLAYCGYIGGLVYDQGFAIAVDGSGNAYVTGATNSSEASFPVVIGPDLIYNNGNDAFVAKINAAGTALVYCGYIGGFNEESGTGIAVDSAGNAYVTGSVTSTGATFPAVVGPFLAYSGGGQDGFVAKVNAAGTALVYCGYLGGTKVDAGYAVAVDSSGAAYVTGETNSSDFPVLVGPSLAFGGANNPDAFVTKVRADGTGLVYSGYIGGSRNDYGRGVAVDGSGNAYVTGRAESTEGQGFPVAVGPDLTFNLGTSDGFVAKVDAAGTAFVYVGYIGGSLDDDGRGIAVDGAGSAYLTGLTRSTPAQGFPVTVGPDLTYNGTVDFDAFVCKVKPVPNDPTPANNYSYCGYIGGSGGGADVGNGIAVDASGNAYVAGYTASTEAQGFPVVGGPDLTANGSDDAFVAKVNAAGTALVYSGYVGGSGGDYGNGIAVDGAGTVYLAGYTTSTQAQGFPVTVGPDLSHNAGVSDAFVAKITAPNGAQMRVLSGSYTGDGADNRPIFVGFQPDVVIVDRDDPTPPGTNNEAVIRTSTMTGDNSKNMDHATGMALAANLVQSLDAQGFTIGTDINVNESGTHVLLDCVPSGAGPAQGRDVHRHRHRRRTSRASASRPRTFSPCRKGARNVVQKSVSMPANFSLDFSSVGYNDRDPEPADGRLQPRHKRDSERPRQLPLRGLGGGARQGRGRQLRGQRRARPRHHGGRLLAGVGGGQPVGEHGGQQSGQRAGPQAGLFRGVHQLGAPL